MTSRCRCSADPGICRPRQYSGRVPPSGCIPCRPPGTHCHNTHPGRRKSTGTRSPRCILPRRVWDHRRHWCRTFPRCIGCCCWCNSCSKLDRCTRRDRSQSDPRAHTCPSRRTGTPECEARPRRSPGYMGLRPDSLGRPHCRRTVRLSSRRSRPDPGRSCADRARCWPRSSIARASWASCSSGRRRHNYSHSTRRPRIGSTGIRWDSRKAAHSASCRKSQ